MAFYNKSLNTITLRIVYDGLGFAGKTTNVQAIYDNNALRRRGPVITPEVVRGRTAYFDWLELATGTLDDDYVLRCQVLTVPGQFEYAPRRWELLRGPDAIVAICDSSPLGVKRGRIGLDFLHALRERGVFEAPILVQANKRDLPDAVDLGVMRTELGLTDSEDIVEAVASAGIGVQLTFMKALDLARIHVRKVLSTGGVERLDSSIQTPQMLVETLRAELDHPDHDAYLVTDEIIPKGDS
jgi:mutual gliding-motility protein MglA